MLQRSCLTIPGERNRTSPVPDRLTRQSGLVRSRGGLHRWRSGSGSCSDWRAPASPTPRCAVLRHISAPAPATGTRQPFRRPESALRPRRRPAAPCRGWACRWPPTEVARTRAIASQAMREPPQPPVFPAGRCRESDHSLHSAPSRRRRRACSGSDASACRPCSSDPACSGIGPLRHPGERAASLHLASARASDRPSETDNSPGRWRMTIRRRASCLREAAVGC